MSGVTAIRQRKQWTADLDTLTDGVADWDIGSGTPDGTGIAWSSVISISGNTQLRGASWAITWSGVQQPRYTKLTANFAITFTKDPVATGNWTTFLQQGSPLVNASASGTGASIVSTVELNVVPSARPTLYSIGFSLGGGDLIATAVTGTITLTWS